MVVNSQLQGRSSTFFSHNRNNSKTCMWFKSYSSSLEISPVLTSISNSAENQQSGRVATPATMSTVPHIFNWSLLSTVQVVSHLLGQFSRDHFPQSIDLLAKFSYFIHLVVHGLDAVVSTLVTVQGGSCNNKTQCLVFLLKLIHGAVVTFHRWDL